jgi:aminopeptidase N
MNGKISRRARIGALAFVAALIAAAPASAERYVPGSPGLGDPFFPLAGNGGYDVQHYSLDLEYDRGPNLLAGEATIRAKATQNLSRFDLDFRGYEIRRLRVNGERASFARDGQELIITPKRGLKEGRSFVVEVDYRGQPEPVVDPDESIEGWIPTDDGAFVVNEPQGSPGWYPANDHPRDKATYDFEITVPAGRVALGNGLLVSRVTRKGKTTWRWREDSPMAPYLATATNGVFETRFGRLPNGLPEYNAVDPNAQTAAGNPDPAAAWALLDEQPEVVSFFTDLYGEYPFTSIGAIIDNARFVGYALESQTKPNYHRIPSKSTLVHEIAHMWFGDSVTLSSWPDIWLNEGFATWSEWIYDEHHGGQSAAQTFDTEYARPPEDELWNPPPADLGSPANLFHEPPYTRGAMTLQALREKAGDDAFFRILRRWYSENRNGLVSTADFIALAERETGLDLDAFFHAWLYQPGKPTSW